MTEVKQYTVKSGDSAWVVAKKTLQQKNSGSKVTNAQIMKEMERLAKLNHCDSVEDFNNKYFGNIGKNLIIDENSTQKRQRLIKTKTPQSKKDTLRMDTTKFETRQDNTKVVRDTFPQPTTCKDSVKTDTVQKKKYSAPALSSFQKEAAHINHIKGSKNRIIEYNKKHAKGNYVIVDKKTCQATVYSKDGKPLKSYEVLLGATKGDDLATAFAKDQKVAAAGRRTVPGEFKLGGRVNQFGGMRITGERSETMDPDVEIREWMPGYCGKKKMVGRGSQAIHGTADRKHRDKLYNDGNLDNNRQSMGCINIPLKDLNEMESKYGIKANSTLYVLPETKGNELVLTKQKDGTVKFLTKYKDAKQNEKVKKIQDAIANKKIQKQLAAKKKKESQERLLAEQKEVHLLQPSTWKNIFS